MYLKTFGLQEKPFHITPNPRFIFLSKKHKEAFAHLLYGIQQRVGFLSLTGEVGTGKTTVLRTFLRQLEQSDYRVALIFNPCLSSLELLQAIHREFGISFDERAANLSKLHDSLNCFLVEQRQNGKTVVLVIDEAQNLDILVLEQLRLLSNLETETDKLLQLVIVGQPELDDILNRRDLRQLKQRLIVRYRLTNMDEEDTAAYIKHRLKVAGCTGTQLFTEKAIHQVYKLSGGLPRLINILCDRALLVAYTRESGKVDHKSVREAQHELAGELTGRRSDWLRRGLIVSVSALLGVTVFFYTDHRKAPPEVQPVYLTAPERSMETARQPILQPEPEPVVPDQALLAAAIGQIDSLGEKESGRIAVTALLERWGKDFSFNSEPDRFRPLDIVLSNQGMSVIKFQGDVDRLLEFDTPAILSVVLPNIQGKRYLAVLEYSDGQILTAPALTVDGWLPIDFLADLWFGKAVIPWNNTERLPYLDNPGDGTPGVGRTQEFLRLAGYPDLEVSGIYDRATIAVVSDLQKRTGLAPDGRIGAQTLLQLYRLVGVDMPQLQAGHSL